jgi:tetratricopeptide (TPR) repeat protein
LKEKKDINMKGRTVITALIVVIVLSNVLAFAEPDAKRLKAMNTLWRAYTQFQQGLVSESLKGVDEALSIDPDLAYANIVKGEITMKLQDWETSKRYFERGLSFLRDPDQPLSPSPQIEITFQEVEGDTRCFLGYVYIKLAQKASRSGDSSAEQKYLELAQKYLKAGLKLSPGDEARELAEGLLKKFK